MKIRPLYFVLMVVLLMATAESAYNNLVFFCERTAELMGTTARVKVEGPMSPYLAQRALYEIEKIDIIFNKFSPKSEIALINTLAGNAPLQVSSDTFNCINLAVKINRLTQGAFDITLGNARDLVLSPMIRKVYLKRKGEKIDLGGIGKGFAVEAARHLLLMKGSRSGMVDMHSSIAVFGQKIWRIGIQHPSHPKEILGVVELNNGQSLSTSGDYAQGKHIIDPRTGKPAEDCQAVTVIGSNAAEMDALSTGIFVLGPQKGMALIKSLPGVEGLIVDREGRVTKSSGFHLINI